MKLIWRIQPVRWIVVFWSIASSAALLADDQRAIDIGDRRELFVDRFLLDRLEGVELRLHSPTPREVVMVCDAAWEGSGCGYETVFRDGPIIRMYYIAADLTSADGTKMASRPVFACYAESRDGIRWVKPDLGLFEFGGSKHNNIVWSGPRLDNFTPMKDPNPDSRPGEQYKAVAAGPGGLWAYKSADGLHWSPLADQPVITKGAFDTQNNAFWDPLRRHYWCYVRDFHSGIRDIRVATSPDFRTWTEPALLQFADAPDEALYTNQILPYHRAPHLFLGFPTRYVERPWAPSMTALPDPEHRQRRMKFHPRFGTAVTDGLFMSSRDGRTFHRFDEAFLRPGPERRDNWVYGDCYQSLGLLETPAADPTAPPELTLYVGENHWKGPKKLRRYTLRMDGFASLSARSRGEFVTKPLTFRGKELALNFSTSAAGHLRVELQDDASRPLPGFGLADSDELFGDTLQRVVTWQNKSDVSALAGRPIRLHIAMRDADIYSVRFQP
jgi:hypothetical protein